VQQSLGPSIASAIELHGQQRTGTNGLSSKTMASRNLILNSLRRLPRRADAGLGRVLLKQIEEHGQRRSEPAQP